MREKPERVRVKSERKESHRSRWQRGGGLAGREQREEQRWSNRERERREEERADTLLPATAAVHDGVMAVGVLVR
ncbi:hypothetical protein HanRHA438_Chr13g0581301 [Helianthus annuus]|uniref:Uncharacterized protein n=1 Tax=Helianthus annuus TaxID=4232 RepID=A0A251SPL7_HELAN|nr:hypothetical protein HanXRQr2_Chr13g0570011 [Helianthus annuus]KAJ0475598.1 hypothetical protein HanHA300_Chr13g0467291 [Helianthus annuus]KAJ0479511.1 hypothetical protein HanIR_Chr13g0620801 [Helianthus annuus]KAJ0496381.1 hypothetical protein HanHA89_Chr13g0499031 [Helianthus annuus]KAJ0662440.1 hypothetical protein HanLR1_Chr13g0469461 [Helianthus annuus]